MDNTENQYIDAPFSKNDTRVPNFLEGEVLLFDKPKGWTSFDVVNKVRFALRKYLNVKNLKVGHAGTLDPMATGLLIICTGKMTKQIDQYQAMEKVYSGTMQLGKATPSYDAETEPTEHFPTEHITPETLEAARQQFLGDIAQKPPMFSAIKVDGQPLYKKARQGVILEVEARQVSIYEFNIDIKNMPTIGFFVRCSKGTYIRSLAHDFGKALHSGAYLTDLRREQIGHYKVNNAWQLEHFSAFIHENMPRKEDV